jgi:hypothetical protein
MKKTGSRYAGLLGLSEIFLLLIATQAYAEVPKAQNPEDAGCLACHRGIEQIADNEDMQELLCTDCHNGNPEGDTADAAHEGMYANPADFRVVDEICGDCHEEIVEASKRSLHATSAGIISATRYTAGAQNTRNALYATYAVADEDGDVPTERGALAWLAQVPHYDPSKPLSDTNHLVDDYLRDQCLRCHLWSSGHERDGDYRGSGCVACHMVYSDEGTYEGDDEAIPKDQKDRPRLHRLTKKVPVSQCLHCHNRGGRTGVSYIGTMESDHYGSPWSTESAKKGGKKLHGKYYNHLTADVHYEKGMLCIDCHTVLELHGDGNIYSKGWQAVEIECEDCHGTAEAYSDLTTSWGNPLENLERRDTEIVLISKMDGEEHLVPQTKDVVARSSPLAETAMGIADHMEKLECYACHARWAPQCYGCHAQQDTTKTSRGWIDTLAPGDPTKAGTKANRGNATFQWKETRSYLRWETPALGINTEGKVAPFIPGCQAIYTQIGPDGEPILHNKVFMTDDGLYGIAHNPIQPHTVTKEARTCEDCHASRKALGLGTGVYNSRANGLDIPFELERFVDEQGKQIQATSHYGARPFHKQEQERILRVNTCMACHENTKDAEFWKKVSDAYGFAENDERHKEIIGEAFKKSIRKSRRPFWKRWFGRKD